MVWALSHTRLLEQGWLGLSLVSEGRVWGDQDAVGPAGTLTPVITSQQTLTDVSCGPLTEEAPQ